MRTKTAILLLLAVVLATTPAFAGSASALMNVSVEVVARTILTVDSQPASVDVTPADVARGYVDVTQAVTFRVRSNASSGYAMQFQPVGYPFQSAMVSWGNSLVTVGNDAAWLTQPYQPGTTSGTLSVRLMLGPGTQPGTYAWPVSFAAQSL